jgi:hypothetical protein
LTDRGVLRLELGTLYELDEDGRLVRERRADLGSFFTPPLVAVACGADGIVWACAVTVPAPIVVELDALLRAIEVPGALPPVGWTPAGADDLLALLPGGSEVWRGPSYVADVDRSAAVAAAAALPAGGELRTSDDTDLADVRPLLPERDAILDPPWVVAIVGGEVAAVCETARSAATSVEAGVWTYEPHRRKGLATVVTAAWLELVGGDRTAFYSTSADNVASQAVARRLGLTPIGQWWQVRAAERD